VGDGFTVNPAVLASGTEQVQTLQDRCASLGSSATSAMAGMAGAAGEGALASALNGVAHTAKNAFASAAAVYEHVGQGLAQSARSYAAAESSTVQRLQGVAGRYLQ
jgi:hypothetical protein